MKLFRSLLLTSSAIAFEFTVWDQPDEDGKCLDFKFKNNMFEIISFDTRIED